MSFIKITEQPSLHEDLEQLSVRSLLEGINEEDQKVALAVRSCIPHIERLVTGIVERMQQGGRVFYIGAGTSGRLGGIGCFGDSTDFRYARYLYNRYNSRRRNGSAASGGKCGRRHVEGMGRIAGFPHQRQRYRDRHCSFGNNALCHRRIATGTEKRHTDVRNQQQS